MEHLLQPAIIWLLTPVILTLYPKFFPCENYNSSVDCMGRELTSVPRICSTDVQSLNLTHNHIRVVGREAFSCVPNLKILSLMWNCAPGLYKDPGIPICTMTIDHLAFMTLSSLEVLELSGNSLTTIPDLPVTLHTLNFDFNSMPSVTNPLGTPSLHTLQLAKNCFYNNPCNQTFIISQEVLQQLQELKVLFLGFNNISKVPEGLPHSLTHLDLSENKITEIPSEAFKNLTKLEVLNLAWNCQRCDHAAEPCFPCPDNMPLNLSLDIFKHQNKSLRYLSLRGNSLKRLPSSLFAPLKKLKTLNLSDNLLAYDISHGDFFKKLQSVTSLNLMYNYEPLQSFKQLNLSPFFRHMSRLRFFYLQGFFFRSLSNDTIDILRSLQNLEFLDLRSNFISVCNMSVFRDFKALKKVLLAENQLDFIPLCRVPKEEQFSEGLEQTELLFKRKDVQDPRDDSQDNPSLEPTLKTSSEPYDRIWPNFTMHDFYKTHCTNDLTFDLSYNNILTVNKSIFQDMEKVVCLDMSFNYMSIKPNGHQFSPLRSLVFLNLANNRLDLYFLEAFRELNLTLKVLDLSSNSFSFLEVGIGHRLNFLQHLTSLEALSLNDNQIGYRVNNLESNSLKYLYFAGNRLSVMWGTSDQFLSFFQNLSSLIHLDISRNQLKRVWPEALVRFPNTLHFLRVDDNQLSFFPWHNITALPQLHYLNLSGNYLTTLPNTVVHFGTNFSGLDLSHNQIAALNKKFFSHMRALIQLRLNNNRLKLLDAANLPAPFINGSALRELTLQGNPFTCSCATSWFVEYLHTTNLTIPKLTTMVRCGFPESLQDVNILSVDPRSCQEIYGGIAFLSSALLTIILTVFPLLKHLYGWDLWYCFQVLWAGYKGYSKFRGSFATLHYEHDAFVVFDTSNEAVRDWIYNEMVDNLENKGRWRFKVCLEERDWVPGLPCIENLHNAVHNSRKTVFVLTNSGAGYQLCGVIRQAFLLVQQRLLDEKVDVAVMVLLDPHFHNFKYLQMRKRLCKKSVLSWPPNPLAQPVFWHQLRVALVSDNVYQYDKKVTGIILPE